METTLSDVLQIVVVIAFIIGAIWTVLEAYRHFGSQERPARFTRMMQRLGMRATAAGEWQIGLYLPNAFRLCHHCDKKAECDAWLAESGKAAVPPAFCANANLPHLVSALPWNRAD
jgi:hypothetical protein